MSNYAQNVQESLFHFRQNGDLEVKNAVIIWKNFSGRPTKYVPAGGKRTFTLVLTQEMADVLRDRGWNVRVRPAKEEGDADLYYTEISVRYNTDKPQYNPSVYFLSEVNGEKYKQLIPEEAIGQADDERFAKVDLLIHAYAHGVETAKSKVKGYLRSMFATVEVDSFELEYSDYRTVGETSGEAVEMPW